METQVLDYVHDYIEVDGGDASLLEAHFEGQLERLRRLQHLGLIGKIYRLARHHKLEHAYGTYWLCRRAEESTTRLRLNAKAMRLAGMLHSIGHLPFSYATEHALLQLYHIHQSTKEWMDGIFKQCIDFVDDPKLKDMSDKLLKTNDSYGLYRWLSAVKVATTEDMQSDLGKQIARHLVDSSLFGYRLLRELDRLDYVLRDLLYLGKGRIQLTMKPFLAQFKRGPEDVLQKPELFKVIDALNNSLNNKVYMDSRVRCLAQVVGRALLSEVIEGHLAAEEFLEMDDSDFENRLKTFKSRAIDMDDLVARIAAGKLVEVARTKCDGGLLVDREAQIAGTKKPRLHVYPQNKGIYVECLPFWDKVDGNVLSLGIAYDHDSEHVENLVGAFLRAEEWAPYSDDSVELSYREHVISFILGFAVHPQFERFRDAQLTVMRHMSKVWQQMEKLPLDEWEEKAKLWHEKWEMREWGYFRVAFSEKPDEWLTNHFLRFPEHFHTEHIESIKRLVERSRRRRGESLDICAKRKEHCLEYASYLKAILEMRQNSRVGWVLPCVKLSGESGQEEREIDVVSVSVPRPHKGPVRVGLYEVSKDQSDEHKLGVQKNLNRVAHKVQQRFRRGIELVATFNGVQLKVGSYPLRTLQT